MKKAKKTFTFVLTYTISNGAVANDYNAFITSEDGLNAEYIDQSTYGTRIVMKTKDALYLLRDKLNELYRYYKVSTEERVDDKAFVLRADGVFKTGDKNVIDLFDVFDFE